MLARCLEVVNKQHTLYQDLQETSASCVYLEAPCYSPIPITVPYSARLSSSASAFTDTGQKQRRARRARHRIVTEEATLRARVLDGRRGRDMVEGEVVVHCGEMQRRELGRVLYG